MAHRYGDPVRVSHPGKEDQAPDLVHLARLALLGRGHRDAVWHLRGRWWEEQRRHSDRSSFRVMTADFQVFELSHDTVADARLLDIVHK